jgi:NAD-dependent dihydropyrimidine dehydrogenase PreA subunit
MNHLRYLGVNVVQTLLRVIPFPCRTGLVRIGTPGRDSPVLLTGNFRLTVERVIWTLKGIDAYLLVANSRGVNVWCAATGGLLRNHDVVSVLKTSGVGDLVDHRRVILPQLAATGVEGRIIHEKTGWHVVWGPVDAHALPAFLRHGLQVTPAMRRVRFAWPQRLEMAVAWAFPISLLTLLLFPIWSAGVLPLVGLVWLFAFVLFLSFPLYSGYLGAPGKHLGFIFFDFGRYGVPLILWGLYVMVLTGSLLARAEFSWLLWLRWCLSALVVVVLLSIDLMGSTPVYKSGLHADRLLRITLDHDRCKGAGFCEAVCPVDVFVVDHHRRIATLPRAAQCVQCGACIVQCPFDALYFRGPEGALVTPDTVRRFKLNLLGHRLVKSRG